ncbi:MAG: Inosine-uridine preferring nucleoside hydrolase [Planctomycetes bacterium ADurb.Bin126]|nr:MAG: Inosine-uridine preferring nucleoside hydrolase [Planctomycetes bacterium ADurb.Bin126]HOD81553.1 nucleoside hydrolase [Phycisphaerae bacterium]HQL72957.1 nucleoside hydrolase [Phycisphaerae bacterium]
MKCWFAAAILALLTAVGASAAEANKPVSIIFDTDIGSDCDDAGALAVLHALTDRGEVDLLGVIFSSGRNRFGAGACDAINTWYGRGHLPLGQYKKDDVGDPGDSYSSRVAKNTKTFGHDIIDDAPEMVATYKALLRGRPASSVTILSVGHPHGLVHLMRDKEGAELVRAKVARWVAMGGSADTPASDWNFTRNGMDRYLGELLANWPTEAIFSPDGADVITGNRLLPKTSPNNPVRECYRYWGGGKCLQTGRSSWDQIAVLAAVRPQYFTFDRHGRQEPTKDGKVFWDAKVDNPKHIRARVKIDKKELADIIEGLMAAPPGGK